MRRLAALAALAVLSACSQGGTASPPSGAALTTLGAASGLRGPPGPRGVPGPQGATGPQGLTGATGPAGASIETVVIAGLVEELPGSSSCGPAQADWVFAGPTTSVGLGAEDRVTASGSIALGLSHPCSGVEASLTFCLQPEGGAVTPLMPDVFTNVPISCTLHVFPVVGSAVPGEGTYELGFCARRLSGKGSIDRNDYAIAWAQILRALPATLR